MTDHVYPMGLKNISDCSLVQLDYTVARITHDGPISILSHKNCHCVKTHSKEHPDDIGQPFRPTTCITQGAPLAEHFKISLEYLTDQSIWSGSGIFKDVIISEVISRDWLIALVLTVIAGHYPHGQVLVPLLE